ncbi:mechanosensitive ion channel family protein [Halobaculum sp. MBLA0143]|uniref:mechanosensitive ion channel family protein n=1 Tax=Halobaculum sp. MBLA0143 TaxID=3079933 RepID=UPI003524BAE3
MTHASAPTVVPLQSVSTLPTEVAAALGGLPLWQAVAVVVAATAVLAVATERVGLELLRRVVARTDSAIDDAVFAELRLPVVTSVFLGGVYAVALLPATAAVLGDTAVQQLLGRPALSVVLLVWARGLIRVADAVVETMRAGDHHYDVAPVLSNVWTLAVGGAAGFGLLSLWTVDVTPLLGAAGVAGVAVGFAAKDTVANFFGGLALYVDDTYRVGDFVVLEDGDSGTVVDVGVRSTTLLTRGEVLVTVPNSTLNAGKVTNESAPERRKRIKVPVGVGYDTNLDAFEAAALAVADGEPLVLAQPCPRMRFRSFGDSALQYDLLCWVASPTVEGKTRHRVNRGLYAALTDAGVDIPFPQRSVTVADGVDRGDPTDADGGPVDPTAGAPGGDGEERRA